MGFKPSYAIGMEYNVYLYPIPTLNYSLIIITNNTRSLAINIILIINER